LEADKCNKEANRLEIIERKLQEEKILKIIEKNIDVLKK
jgi:hypothetical protein